MWFTCALIPVDYRWSASGLEVRVPLQFGQVRLRSQIWIAQSRQVVACMHGEKHPLFLMSLPLELLGPVPSISSVHTQQLLCVALMAIPASTFVLRACPLFRKAYQITKAVNWTIKVQKSRLEIANPEIILRSHAQPKGRGCCRSGYSISLPLVSRVSCLKVLAGILKGWSHLLGFLT
jgi:hypothetical protein